nr:ATP-dependent Clp protease adaptor ClpS [Angustibacter aerolatus]
MVTSPVELDEPVADTDSQVARPWVTLVWNDPVNLMEYVTYVFQSLLRLLAAEGRGAHARRAPEGPRRRRAR